jgi:peroxiredoxin/Flp pilus assembly protein TadD
VTSQSPLSETATLDYSDSWAAVNRLIREGESWSGRELNCGLMNTGDGSFIDASNTMGLAFPDDGRNFVSCDWDGDGDLDLWVKNRTAPMVRFLRNDAADGNWVRFQVMDRMPNWEAIGARIEVRAGGKTLVSERRLGGGFLVQESAWMHFGLGTATTIDEITVRWPGGEVETFAGVPGGARYLLSHGKGKAVKLPDPLPGIRLKPSVVVPPAPKDVARVVLTRHLPLPELEVTDMQGALRPLRDASAQSAPMLLTFWASWCPNCIKELRSWSNSAQELQEAGASLLALSVDEDPESARNFWQRLDLPFTAGYSTPRVTALFDLLQRIAVDHRRDMAVPTSFLLDAQGNIAVIYRGPVELETVIADIANLSEPSPAFAGAPFPGRAFGEAQGLRMFDVARRLLDRDAADDALFYLNQGESALSRSTGAALESDKASLADALMRAGVAFMDNGKLKRAAAAMARATALAGPDDAIIWFAKAKLESVRGQHDQAVLDVQRAVELDPLFATGWNMLGSLYLIQSNLPASIEAHATATKLDPSMAEAWSGLGIANLNSKKFKEGHEAFQQLLRLSPKSPDAWTGLGVCLIQLGEAEPGIAALKKALAFDPQNARALGILKSIGVR